MFTTLTQDQVLLVLEALYNRVIKDTKRYLIAKEEQLKASLAIRELNDKGDQHLAMSVQNDKLFFNIRKKDERFESTYCSYTLSKLPWKDRQVKKWVNKFLNLKLNYGTEHQVYQKIYEAFPEVVDNSLERDLLGRKD